MDTTAKITADCLIDDWLDQVARMDARNPQAWWNLDLQLAENQYSYIKLGLLLEKIRNNSYWKYCGEKLSSFKQFCLNKINLTCWQANSYIEAAKIAIYLKDAGFTVLPKNYSQALALGKVYQAEVGYYLDRPALEQAWSNITTANEPSEITANKIRAEVDPGWAERQPIKLPQRILDRAKKMAKLKGMTVEEFLGDLMDGAEDLGREPIEPATSIEETTELDQVLDDLDLEFPALSTGVPTADRQIDRTVTVDEISLMELRLQHMILNR
jgi:hypothetical protein